MIAVYCYVFRLDENESLSLSLSHTHSHSRTPSPSLFAGFRDDRCRLLFWRHGICSGVGDEELRKTFRHRLTQQRLGSDLPRWWCYVGVLVKCASYILEFIDIHRYTSYRSTTVVDHTFNIDLHKPITWLDYRYITISSIKGMLYDFSKFCPSNDICDSQ